MHLRKFQKHFKNEYNFFPHTWLYPFDFHQIQEYYKKKQDKRAEDGIQTDDPVCLFIVKPEAGCQGKGIFIAKSIDELRRRIDQNLSV